MLHENLMLKHPLSFNKDGKFKIIMFADIQDSHNPDKRTIESMDKMLEKEKPDLVLWCGDNSYGMKTEHELNTFLNEVAAPMENRKIPWAHVFGNHDCESGLDEELQQKVYESFPYCISKRGPFHVYGTGNYVLPIKASDSDKIKFNVWGLDSNQYLGEVMNGIYDGDIDKDAILPNYLYGGNGYAHIRFEQIMWYWNSSVELEKYNNNEKIPALMYFHIPLDEFWLIHKNPAETNMQGEDNEHICAGEINSGMFSAILERGDVKGVFCGHDHTNSYVGTYCGIKLGYVPSIGFATYGLDGQTEAERHRLRGARIFEIEENNPQNINTRLIYANEFIEI